MKERRSSRGRPQFMEEKRMISFKAFAAASCLGLMTFAPSALADQWNKRTILTVNEPIQVPGKVLEPGKYVMKLMDSPSNRHIVQIFNEREDQLQTTILAIPNYRLQPTGETEFGWWETPAGQPKAMRAWFYPGDNFGQEFAYPKNEAVSIAQRTNENVPTTYAESEADLATARVGSVDKAGTEMELDRKTYTAPEPQQEVAQNQSNENQQHENQQMTQQSTQTEVAPVQREEPTTMAQNRQPTEDTYASRTLPRTASPMPLFGLAGFLAIGAGVAFRAIGNRL
jgi:hypothetical protein